MKGGGANRFNGEYGSEAYPAAARPDAHKNINASLSLIIVYQYNKEKGLEFNIEGRIQNTLTLFASFCSFLK
ncbi:hypothetical protein HU137_08110 [Moheibacter sp. BDHS18]|uniref:Uncharacterized protein n=1 Tax=Moheibacter lacus TaxID=2745851 RepID=A0A838ZJB2_9FLAO|nr:hypothetical protein [Moheibacter lacus]